MSRVARRFQYAVSPATSPADMPSPVKIMPLGDSITMGAAFNEQDAYPGAYRVDLWRQLVAVDGYNIDFVGYESNGPPELPDKDHQGQGGWWLKDSPYDPPIDMYSYIIDWLTVHNPDVVLLHGGTNELYSARGGPETLDHLDALTARIFETKPNIHLVVACIIGRVPDQYVPDPQNFYEYQAGIPSVVNGYKTQGKKIYLADMHDTLNLNTDYADILHPNQAGYAKMATVWRDVLVGQVLSA